MNFIRKHFYSLGNIPTVKIYILNLYKGKEIVLDQGNNCGLKLTDQVSKVIERKLATKIYDMVSILIECNLVLSFAPATAPRKIYFYEKPLFFELIAGA